MNAADTLMSEAHRLLDESANNNAEYYASSCAVESMRTLDACDAARFAMNTIIRIRSMWMAQPMRSLRVMFDERIDRETNALIVNHLRGAKDALLAAGCDIDATS